MATLISTIGTGSRNGSTGEYEYKRVQYQFREEQPVETSYIGKAILKFSLGKDIDRVIILGTPSTGWANLLSGFDLENKKVYQDFYLELKIIEENARSDKSVGISGDQLSRLQEILSNSILSINFELHLIPLAYESQELWGFLSKLVDLILSLPDNEHIVIDVTHGFRHHQIFMASILGFINQLSVDSNRKIRLVYGALGQDKDKANPVIELDMIVAMHEWSAALNSFLSHGDSEQLAKLIRDYRFKEAEKLAKTLETLSFEIAGNYVFIMENGKIASLPKTLNSTIRHIDGFLKKSGQMDSPTNNFSAVKYVLDELTKWTGKFVNLSDPVDLLFALAQDHLKRRRYLLALTSCWEGLRIYQSLVTRISHYERDSKEKIQEKFKKELVKIPSRLKRKYYGTCYSSKGSLRSLRNQIVHCLPPGKEGHVHAMGLRNQVKERVNETIEVVRKLQTLDVDYENQWR